MVLSGLQVRASVEKVLNEMNRSDGIYFEKKVCCSCAPYKYKRGSREYLLETYVWHYQNNA
eukprot:2086258-Amphidinium_carterae.1